MDHKNWLLIFVLCLTLASVHAVRATHLRAAAISVERVNDCPGLTFRIKVTVFLDSKSDTRFGGTMLSDGHINFGDGTVELIPDTETTPRPDLGVDVGVAEYTTIHTFSSPGIYKINYFERDRSEGVLNMTNSGETAYSSSITINLEDPTDCNTFPKLGIPPVDRACSGNIFSHTPGAYDENGDSLSYEITVPSKDINTFVDGYIPVDDPSFYLNYATGNEAENGPPTFTVNPMSGLITWNAPGHQGQYNIAFAIIEWRRDPVTRVLRKLSTTIRDMQILVEECEHARPELVVPANLCVLAGTPIHEIISGFDPEGDEVKIEPFSELFDLPADKGPASYSPAVAVYKPSTPHPQVEFSWTPTCNHVREQPYQVVFKITDKPRYGTALVTFKTWNIKVIAPKPTLATVDLDAINQAAGLGWDDYTCHNATGIQVWRKVDNLSYTPSLCETGIPSSSGYELVATVNPSLRSYRDSNNNRGLSPGARYCYRLVAIFGAPGGGKSYVSNELCIGPIQADAAVITNVSVVKTDGRQGQMRVSWRSPLTINQVLFPKPYQYEVFRADGKSGDKNIMRVGDARLDSTLLDTNLNTEKIYNYRVVVYAKVLGGEYRAVDTSAVASSVYLEAKPGPKKITLSWSAMVPWSNVVQTSPYHLVFRGPENAGDDALTLIDSVDVTKDGFNYVDQGQYQNKPLDPLTQYTYKVMTRGTYGNPNIALQENFSQRLTLYPENTLLPCTPVLSVDVTDCDRFLSQGTCDELTLSNTIHWRASTEEGCRSDIKRYKVYASSSIDSTFTLLDSLVTDTTFTEMNLPSFVRCYKVIAVDGLGHESTPSNIECNDNCPYYDLPNIFTPNGDGCNDLFSAYRADDDVTCSISDLSRCPRFVDEVNFVVYNRWGKTIYSFRSGNGNSININWDGRDDSGTVLDAAVYYFRADVTFNTLYPGDRHKVIKGWVQIMR